MIKCPKCGSEHVSIVTKITSEQTRSRFLEIILTISTWTAVIGLLMLLIALKLGIGIDIMDLLFINTLTKITTNIIIGYIAIKIILTSIITAFICGTVIKLMPYEIHSVDKCICHECECKWLRNNEQKEE